MKKKLFLSACALIMAGSHMAMAVPAHASVKSVNHENVKSGLVNWSTKSSEKNAINMTVKTNFTKNKSHGFVMADTDLFGHPSHSNYEFYRQGKDVVTKSHDMIDWTHLAYPTKDLNYLGHVKQIKALEGLYTMKGVKVNKLKNQYVIKNSKTANKALARLLNNATANHRDNTKLTVKNAKITEKYSKKGIKSIDVKMDVMQNAHKTELKANFSKLNSKQTIKLSQNAQKALTDPAAKTSFMFN